MSENGTKLEPCPNCGSIKIQAGQKDAMDFLLCLTCYYKISVPANRLKNTYIKLVKLWNGGKRNEN